MARRTDIGKAMAARVLILLVAALLATGATGGCIGARFDAGDPAAALDQPTRALVDGINAQRAGKQLPPGNWVPELRVPAVRSAMSLARGDQGVRAAAHSAAQGGVTAVGRHVWSFATECTDLRLFRPPQMVTDQKVLLFSLAAVPGAAGKSLVMLLVAEPGPSALRAEQMGGGRGGTNPTLETYVHPVVATGPCGEGWPAAQRSAL